MSDNSLDDTIRDFLSAPPYYRCLLLVHPEIRRLDAVGVELRAAHRWPHLSLGLELSAHLMSVPPTLRSSAAHDWLDSRLREHAPGPLLWGEIDLLFEPSLELDPLRLARRSSRVTTSIVLWPGSYAKGVLAYAQPEHAHYRAWRDPDITVAMLD